MSVAAEPPSAARDAEATPELLVVVVTYNSRDDIEACLTSLLVQLPDDGSRVVVQDNCSQDGTAALVTERFPSVDVVRSDENVGFSRGCNRGAERFDSRYVLLLNPDTVLQPGCLDALVEVAARRPGGGLYGGRAMGPDGEFDPKSCWARPTLWSLFCFASGLSSLRPDSPRWNPEGIGGWARDTEREVDVISGSLLLARRDLWTTVGGLDEDYFMYGEDADLGVRARRLGYHPVITPAAGYVHHVGRSSAPVDKQLLLYRGKATLIRKLWSGPSRWLAMVLLLTGVALRAVGSSAARRLLPTGGRRRERTSPSTWLALWRRRDEWREGWRSARTEA
jgi:GT2 family glycosyltransferase